MTAFSLSICGVMLALLGAYLALQAYDPEIGGSYPLQFLGGAVLAAVGVAVVLIPQRQRRKTS